MQKAHGIADIKKVLSPQALRPEELDEFFVETASARDPVLSRRKELAEQLSGPRNRKVLVYGHSGSGKSTELIKFSQEHQRQYRAIHLSVAEQQIQHDVQIETLLVLVAEATLRMLEKVGADTKLGDERLRQVHAWFAEALDYSEDELAAQSHLAAGFDTSKTWLAKLWGVVAIARTDIRAGAKRLHKVIEKKQNRLSELVRATDELLKEAKVAIYEHEQRELLLIIEDLDKASIRDARRLFIDNPSPLVSLTCKAIYTAPLFLFFSAEAAVISGHFDTLSIPMLKIIEPDGRPSEEGRRLIRDILARRIELDALIEPTALHLAIEKTGGILRHLFNVLIKASLVASNATPAHPTITTRDVRYGLDRLKSDLLQRLSSLGLPGALGQVKVEQLNERLRALSQPGLRRRADVDPVNLVLLQAHALIEYNGKGWHCVHPLVEEHVRS
ncbi:MAG: hypothetical protein AAGF11_38580 [Myxococcota bacterium]